MTTSGQEPLSLTFKFLREQALALLPQARTPYSARPVSAILLLSDGNWVPGIRIESASYSLVIPALINAFSTAAAAGREDVVAALLSRPFSGEEKAYLETHPFGHFVQASETAFLLKGLAHLHHPTTCLSPYLQSVSIQDKHEGIALARKIAERAIVHESNFPVGCVLVTEDERLIPGVNVEHPHWSHILCAERGAVGTALAYGHANVKALYLTCVRDLEGSPCGACRQVLSEFAPTAEIWIDRGEAAPERTSPEQLLPGSFSGKALLKTDV